MNTRKEKYCILKSIEVLKILKGVGAFTEICEEVLGILEKDGF